MHQSSAHVVGSASADEKNSWFRSGGVAEPGVPEELRQARSIFLKDGECRLPGGGCCAISAGVYNRPRSIFSSLERSRSLASASTPHTPRKNLPEHPLAITELVFGPISIYYVYRRLLAIRMESQAQKCEDGASLARSECRHFPWSRWLRRGWLRFVRQATVLTSSQSQRARRGNTSPGRLVALDASRIKSRRHVARDAQLEVVFRTETPRPVAVRCTLYSPARYRHDSLHCPLGSRRRRNSSDTKPPHRRCGRAPQT